MDYEQLVGDFKESYPKIKSRYQDATDCFDRLVRSYLKVNFPNHKSLQITLRVKDLDSCIEKITRKKYNERAQLDHYQYPLEYYITDLIGMRIVCLYEDEVEMVGEILQRGFTVRPDGITNKMQELRTNTTMGVRLGYQALHLDLELDHVRAQLDEYRGFAQIPFEVQIRTIVQDAWSSIEHKMRYKGNPSEETARLFYILSRSECILLQRKQC
jgi:putative GTP pyrophosphokinase